MQRPFASGSRQAPDPYDQFLEQKGFYRKHTARDSSCLFRTISEQMYDTQLHHLEIRKRCVDFMRKHKNLFQESVEKDIDEYLDDLSKPKTFGSLVELRAVGYLYQRNIILFEAYNTGSRMIEEKHFTKCFRVFFTPEKHFDSVFTNDYIENAAFCQAICYEVLYEHVFKLPDVKYAVEQMLHGTSMEFVPSDTQYSGQYAKCITLKDGRKFNLNRPEETHCILDNHILCHFHNPNFPQFADNLHQDMHLSEGGTQYETNKVTKMLDSLLPEKYVSCVRQLLKEGITPFPYKVAKALDPDIYRNIEFDAWSEIRKEQRFKNWYTGGNNLQVGVKCLVKLRGSQNNLFNCHIQDMSPEKGPCLVYIEELAQKHMVSYDALQPLPSDLAKPWPLPFRYQKHIERCPNKGNVTDSRKMHRNCNGKRRYRSISPCNFISTIKKEIYSEDEISLSKDDVAYQLKHFTSIQHYYPSTLEIMAMPLTVDHSINATNENVRNSRRNSANSGISHTTAVTDSAKNDSKKDDENDLEYVQTNEPYPYAYGGYSDPYYPFPYDGGVMHSNSHGPYYCMYNGQPYTGSGNSVVAHGVYVQPTLHCSQQPQNTYFPTPPPCYAAVPPPSGSSNVSTTTNAVAVRNICRRTNTAPGRINLSAGRSILASGSDLPSDIPTLRYFYNLGYEYYKQMQSNFSDCDKNDNKIDQVKKLCTDVQANLKLENDNSYSNQTKPDQINNSNGGGNQHHNSKRFSSRYFNSRRGDKSNYRGGNSNSGNNHHRNGNSDGYGKPNMMSKNNCTNTGNATTNTNNKVSTSNQSSANHISSAEQAIQTSPMAAVVQGSDSWSDVPLTPPLYSAQAAPLQFGQYVPYYPENDQPPNMFLPQPTVMAMPYGMYPTAAPPPPHGSGFQAYLPPSNGQPLPISTTYPPTQSFIASANGNETPSAIINSDLVENAPYAIMGYSPIYYSPTNSSTAMSANGTPIPPGFWYSSAPPQLPPISIPSSIANNNSTTSGTFSTTTTTASNTLR